MNDSEKTQKLKNYYKTVLPSATEAGMQFALSLATPHTIRKKDFYLREGTVCNHVAFVCTGLVRMYHLVDGKEKIMGFCNEMNYISDYRSFLTRTPSQIFIQALEDTEVLETSWDNLQLLYNTVPEANTMGRLIAEKLFNDLYESAVIGVKLSYEQRYELLLATCPWVSQRIPQYMIASYLGITPEGFSRIKARSARAKPQPARQEHVLIEVKK